MDDCIIEFLNKRKEDWLKKNLKANLPAEEQQPVLEEADTKFSLPVWLPDAAKRAGQLSLSSHPSKFSHPNAKTSMIIANAPYEADGLLRSGNLTAETDVLGNAAAMDVYKFLSLVMQDEQTILQHLQQNTDIIRSEFEMTTATFEELRQGLLSIHKQEQQPLTHERVKQVYFPVEDDYHLLSLLTPSGMVYEMRNRIQEQRFSEATKEARNAQRNQEHHPTGYNELYGLAMIGYGGTKPQNISVLNSQYGGKAYLLPGLPPSLEKREIRYPKQDFFVENLWLKSFQTAFVGLHQVFSHSRNNMHSRTDRDDQLVLFIWDQVIHKSWAVRQQQELRPQDAHWSKSDYYQKLPMAQKIWLDNFYQKEREEQDDWKSDILQRFLRWLFDGYSKTMNNLGIVPVTLSDYESRDFKNRLFQPRLENLR